MLTMWRPYKVGRGSFRTRLPFGIDLSVDPRGNPFGPDGAPWRVVVGGVPLARTFETEKEAQEWGEKVLARMAKQVVFELEA